MKKQKIFLVFLAAALLQGALLATVPANPLQAADTHWQATYWNNKTLTGTPALQRSETAVNYDWGDGSPNTAVQADAFSARWTRTINVPSGSSYRFTATMDDGLRVWIDNALIIDSWWDSQVHSLSKDIYLNAGDHAVKIEYYDAGGKAVARLDWTPIGGTSPVPIANWKGEYFNNTNLSGNPVLTRDDPSINFDWGGGTPAWGVVSADQFSARWTRSHFFDAGKYRFTAQADDGMRLWVNGQLLINQWQDSGPAFYNIDVDLPSGSIPLQMEYFENQGGAVARLSWVKLSGSGDWAAQYFNNKTLSGSPALTRNDSQINFNWGSGSPATGINSDNFSVRWNRSVNFMPGRYRFSVTSDDGVRMWVNGQQIINGWSDHKPETFSGEIDLAGGLLPLQVEYYEATGGAQVQVSWTQISGSTPPQPTTPAPAAGTGSVVSAYLNIRTGPGIQYSIITTLVRGQTVTLTGYRSADANWVQINTASGTKAWVSGKSYYLQTNASIANMPVWQSTQPSTPTGPGTATVTNAYYVNLRLGPGVGYSVLTTVPAGSSVTLLGRNSSATWVKMRLANGTQGWMNANYVSTQSAITSLPMISS